MTFEQEFQPPARTLDNVVNAICEILAAEFAVPAEWVRESANIREIPGMESLRLLRAVTKVEKYFGVELSDEDVFSIQAISELAGVINLQLVEGLQSA